jgi:phosphatidylserine decarboxylase
MKQKSFILLQYILPKYFLTWVVGFIARSRIRPLKNFLIRLCIRHYGVDMSVVENKDIESYADFNAFFTRALSPSARPIAAGENTVVSPADGMVSETGAITDYQLLQAKGHRYALSTLLANHKTLPAFEQGAFMTIYLSPKDYHCVHCPYDAKLLETHYIPGKLFSVNQMTANNIPNLFANNERLLCLFETQHGLMWVIFVGAVLVSGIRAVWEDKLPDAAKNLTIRGHRVASRVNYRADNLSFKKGDKLGHFEFGSTAIVLFEKNIFDPMLKAGRPILMGAAIGEF